MLEAKIPSGPIEQQWDKCRFEMKLVNPANRRKHSIIIVGAGLAGAAAAATLGQQGYHVHCFSYHDTPRRAHSIAAQGGINAAKNYRNDGDSISRLFKDTVKGGDFRAREANVYRLAQISVNIIDQCVAQGVPFAKGVRRTSRHSIVWRRPGPTNVRDGPSLTSPGRVTQDSL
jgi:succinate dehydrogenase / fumarate reductase, flavoprotein subunit